MRLFWLVFLVFGGWETGAFAFEECTEEARPVIEDWLKKNPGNVGVFDLYRGLSVANAESRFVSAKTGDDKARHCYVGCRIATDVNLATAFYAGWFKEQRDLTDCDPGTHFDPLDEEATRRGAWVGAGLEDLPLQDRQQACLEACLRD